MDQKLRLLIESIFQGGGTQAAESAVGKLDVVIKKADDDAEKLGETTQEAMHGAVSSATQAELKIAAYQAKVAQTDDDTEKLGKTTQEAMHGAASSATQAELKIAAYQAKVAQADDDAEKLGKTTQEAMHGAASSATQAELKIAAYQAKVNQTEKTQQRLGAEVASGAKSFDQASIEYEQATQQLEEYRRELGLVDDAIDDETEKTIPSNGLKWTEFASQLNVAKQAFNVVARGARATYDILKESASLDLAERQFRNLAESIGTTADALLTKLRAATKGMVSDASLVAGATDIINLGLGKTQGDVVRLATAVSTLGLDMQQVILTFANNSVARLDALGLSIEDVTNKSAELEAAGFKGDSFDEAVLLGLEAKMQLLGDASVTTAGDFKKLESSAQNLGNILKQELVDAASPVVSSLADMAQGLVDIKTTADDARTSVNNFVTDFTEVRKLQDYRDELDKVKDAIDKVGERGSPLTPLATVDTRESLLLLLADFGRTAESSNELEGKMRTLGATVSETGVTVKGMGISWVELQGAIDRLNEQEMLAQITEDFAGIDAKLLNLTYTMDGADKEASSYHNTLNTVNRILVEHGGHLGDTTVQQEELYWSTLTLEDSKKNLMVTLKEEADAHQKVLLAAREEVAAFNSLHSTVSSLQNPVGDLIQAQQDLAAAQGEWVTVNYDNSREIAEINAKLADDLTDDQKKAFQGILKTTEEGSADWLNAWNALEGDLSESARNALVAQRAALGEGGLATVFTGDAEAAEDAQKRIEEANAAISMSYRNTALEVVQSRITEAISEGGADALQAQLAYIQLQEAMGLIGSDESAQLQEIATKTARVTDVTNELLNTYLNDGQLSAQEMENLAGAVSLVEESTMLSTAAIAELADSGIASFDEMNITVDTTTSKLQYLAEDDWSVEADYSSFEDALSTVNDVIDRVNAIPTSVTVDVGFNVANMPNLGGSVTSDPFAPQKVSTGGRLRGGTPGKDSIPALLMPDEVVIPATHTSSLQDAMAFLNGVIPSASTGLTTASNDQSQQSNGPATIIYANSREAMALAMATAQQGRRRRRNEYMGV